VAQTPKAGRGERLAAVRTHGLRDQEVDAFIGALDDALENLADQLDFQALFGQIAEQGYAGWIGCEYKPSDPADSSTSFGWR
jgi:hypothetical protein